MARIKPQQLIVVLLVASFLTIIAVYLPQYIYETYYLPERIMGGIIGGNPPLWARGLPFAAFSYQDCIAGCIKTLFLPGLIANFVFWTGIAFVLSKKFFK